MKYFFSTGEISGANYAANIITELKKIDEKALFCGLGNTAMQNAGCKIIISIEQLSFMGFFEVLKNIVTIKRNFSITQKAIITFNPDVVCLVDYAGFNLKLAKWCKQKGYKVVYYILPKVWAWNANRIKALKQYCDELIGIFPFEVAYFAQHQLPIHFFGNPLCDTTSSYLLETDRKIITFLPGSRKQELEYLLPIVVEIAHLLPKKQFFVGAVRTMEKVYAQYNFPTNVTLIYDNLDFVLSKTKIAIACSGTVTIEVALKKIPQVIVYKTNYFNYYMGKKLIQTKHIGLPNIIANHSVVKELIQKECNSINIINEIKKLEQNNSFYYPKLEELYSKEPVAISVARLLAQLSIK